jgi:hypothetical protein
LADAFAGVAPPIAFIDRNTKKSRAALVADLTFADAKASVMEVQRRPGSREKSRTIIIADETFALVEEKRIHSLLALWMNRGGHLHDISDLPMLKNLRIAGVNHNQSDSAETFAIRILERVIRLIDSIRPDVRLRHEQRTDGVLNGSIARTKRKST